MSQVFDAEKHHGRDAIMQARLQSDLPTIQTVVVKALRTAKHELTPTFVRPHSFGSPTKASRLRPTSYLDGIRAVGTLVVIFTHTVVPHWGLTESAWGRDGGYHYVVLLPFIRLIFCGRSMVYILYVISGYVISYSILQTQKDAPWEKAPISLTTSVLRRWIRLYLPPLVVSFVYMLCTHFGLLEFTRDFVGDSAMLLGGPGALPARLPTLGAQIWHYKETHWARMIDNFTWADRSPEYDAHLWTIRSQFNASVVVYAVLLMLSRVKTKFRMPVLSTITLFCFFWGRWECVIHLAGTALAELDTRNTNTSHILPGHDGNNRGTRQSLTTKIFWTVNLISSLWFLSTPIMDAFLTPGFIWFDTHLPSFLQEERFGIMAMFGAMQFIWVMSRCKSFQPIFTYAPILYLGKISFMMYVLHGPVMRTAGLFACKMMFKTFGNGTFLTWIMGIFVELVVTLVVTTCLSDIVYRLVELKSVSFGRWLESKLFMPPTLPSYSSISTA